MQRGSEHAASLSLQLKQALEEAAALRGQLAGTPLAAATAAASHPALAFAEAASGGVDVASLKDELVQLQQDAVQQVRLIPGQS